VDNLLSVFSLTKTNTVEIKLYILDHSTEGDFISYQLLGVGGWGLGRWGSGEMGSGEMGSGEMGKWGDGEVGSWEMGSWENKIS
jgi:hypothetical protein